MFHLPINRPIGLLHIIYIYISNLPVVHDSYVSEKAKRGLGPSCGLGYARLAFLSWTSLGRLTVLSHPLLTMQNQTVFPFSPVLVIQRMTI
jgi:hypothetical protein